MLWSNCVGKSSIRCDAGTIFLKPGHSDGDTQACLPTSVGLKCVGCARVCFEILAEMAELVRMLSQQHRSWQACPETAEVLRQL